MIKIFVCESWKINGFQVRKISFLFLTELESCFFLKYEFRKGFAVLFRGPRSDFFAVAVRGRFAAASRSPWRPRFGVWFFQDLVHACEASLCQFGELLNVVYFEQKVSSMVAFWVRSCFVIPVTVITILKYLRWKKHPHCKSLAR